MNLRTSVDPPAIEQPPLEEGNSERFYSSTMMVRFSSYKNRVACGVVQAMCLENPIPFCGLDQLLLLLEDIMDYVNASCPRNVYPQASFLPRAMGKSCWESAFQDLRGEKIVPDRGVWPEQATAKHLLAAVTILYRQNASIQGELWAAQQKIRFRSGMELIRLLHQALGQVDSLDK